MNELNHTQPMTDLGKERLRKLIAHLRTVPEKQFFFGTVYEERSCGTIACAMGHAPAVFPDLVEAYVWNERGDWDVRVKGHEELEDYGDSAHFLFEVPAYVCEDLFTPMQQSAVHSSLPNLHNDATPNEVCDMLERFIELTEA